MKFDPKRFIKTAKQTWDLKVDYDKFLAENSHLMAPISIEGLEERLPRQLPGNLTIHTAKSHHGKSTALRNAIFHAQKRIEDTDFMVAIISLEDTAETLADRQVQRYGGYDKANAYQDDSMIFIGNNFNMLADDMGMLNHKNILACLEEGLTMFPAKKGYSHIFIDYIQVIPPDDESEAGLDRRFQIKNSLLSFFNAAKQFKCPIDIAAQALLKSQKDAYLGKMRIPGAADLKEAGEIFEIPDIVLSYWQPKNEPGTPEGSRIEEGEWGFEVEGNLMFLRINKWRNSELMGFVGGKSVIGRVFPTWIRPDGSIFYDKVKHARMMMGANKLGTN